MWFNSFLFLLFLGIVLVVYHCALHNWDLRKRFLLLCSYVFYACWSPPFIALLLLSTTIDYLMGLLLSRQFHLGVRRLLVAVSCTSNLGILGFFKYSRFLIDNYDALVRSLNAPAPMVTPPGWLTRTLLPIGLSFYTFHGMSYIIDVYRGKKRAVTSWIDFSLFICFFPQLVAGPILRAPQFMPQLETARWVRFVDWEFGIWRIILGFFQKVAIADNLAPLANLVFASPQAFSPGQQWIGTYAFAFQIYCDFAGYSNIAIGVARLLGFIVPDNFNLPYLATGFRDFWRRWHISLSSWLRDYLYIPLHGSRNGFLITCRNLIITMFLGGLWHGATWSFALWGSLHGSFLVVEHSLGGLLRRIPPSISRNPLSQLAVIAFTFNLTCLAWVFFRLSNSVADAFTMCRSMLTFKGWWLPATGFDRVCYLVLCGLFYLLAFVRERLRARNIAIPYWVWATAAGCMLYLIIVGWGDPNEFIYFQF